jgi:hypothetical protein
MLFVDAESSQSHEKKKIVIIDGSNVMRIDRNHASFRRLQQALKFCNDKKYDTVYVLCDANLRHKIRDPDEREMFETMLRGKMRKIKFLQSPAGTIADKFILKLGVQFDNEGHGVTIMTNDMFRDLRHPQGENYDAKFEKLLKKEGIIQKFMFIEGANGSTEFYPE